MPKPPCSAICMAIAASVTVSIGDDTSGVYRMTHARSANVTRSKQHQGAASEGADTRQHRKTRELIPQARTLFRHIDPLREDAGNKKKPWLNDKILPIQSKARLLLISLSLLKVTDEHPNSANATDSTNSGLHIQTWRAGGYMLLGFRRRF